MLQIHRGMDGRERDGRGAGAGYSLLEMLVVLSVAALAAGLALPSVAGLLRGQEGERAAFRLLMDLRLAQWRAVVSGRRQRVLPGTAPGGGTGYRIEREMGTVWVADGPARTLPRGVALQASGAAAKVFNPDGTSSSGSLSLATPAGALYRYTLTPATGRVRFYRGDREVARAQ